VQVNVLSGDTGQVLRASVLFQSNVSTSSTVYCRDEIPPEPPVDFDARWDYQDYSLVLSWNFPVNPRRDIKYFQVFRRDSLERPFELLMEYDFNDSFKQPSRLENTYEHLVKKFESPFNIYIDKDFNKDAKYYYAIACVDARGMVSNYSQQFEITFDRIKNKLMKRMVSPSGAPRQYPNVFLKDKQSNTYHNLANGPYTFTSNVTQLNDRFQVVYQNDLLSNTDFDSNAVVASLNEQTLFITAKLPITQVLVYDLSGRLVVTIPVDQQTTITENFPFAAGIYVAKVKLNNGAVVTQKLINKN
jgi:hypothetical protein